MGADANWVDDIDYTCDYCCNFYQMNSMAGIPLIPVVQLKNKKIVKNLLTFCLWGHKIRIY